MSIPSQEALADLQRLARSVHAVTGNQTNAFSRAVAALGRVAESMQSPIAIVGGLAGIYHQTQVTTLDIDIVVAKYALQQFPEAASKAGFVIERHSPDGWHRLRYPDPEGDLDIEVIPAGGKSPRDPADAPAVPSPQQLGVSAGIGYASFPAWVVMKLVANRDKDRYHLVEALKRADQSSVAQAVVELRKLDKRYLQEFERLLRNAEDENAEHW